MLDSGTLTPRLKHLESIGLVQRLRDAAEERHVPRQLIEYPPRAA